MEAMSFCLSESIEANWTGSMLDLVQIWNETHAAVLRTGPASLRSDILDLFLWAIGEVAWVAVVGHYDCVFGS